MISAIVCVDEFGGIGKDGNLLFDIPNDKKSFKNITQNSTVIMGRKTWDSLPYKPLPNRLNIVISNTKHGVHNNALFVNLDEIKTILMNSNVNDYFYIIGGERIYNELFDFCSCIYLTYVHDKKEADAFFPIEKIDEKEWTIFARSKEYDFDGIKYEFINFERLGEKNEKIETI